MIIIRAALTVVVALGFLAAPLATAAQQADKIARCWGPYGLWAREGITPRRYGD
jgi:hypothetical protein